MRGSLIIALDFPNVSETEGFLRQFGQEKLFVKVGMELFYQNGPAVITLLKDKGHDVFLDLKLHDIPNTVKKAMKGLAGLGADLVNVHAAGGKDMMQAALEGLYAGASANQKRPECIAVTQLTSTSASQMNREQLIPGPLLNSVLHYAALSKEAGLAGVVCSPFEAGAIHEEIGRDFITVTPGIRRANDAADDQKRITTPQQARNLGADSIVVGRSITRSPNPLQAYLQMKELWEGITC
ncbi:orotidine-5'-phosphate decarboxylase [Bacillus massiliglaciei]|uniref:orotidine-5'-phosphate decarboxylase n=1 Tax=Bacillus massiliglaciei TaxID=1816693 RepID=UPI000AF4B3BC|nr:orotidine-5'-phosphate decarboxylase [Bacillus massiliglaciei]